LKLTALLLIGLSAFAQAPRNGVPEETTVVDLGGGMKMTAGEVLRIVSAMGGPLPGFFEKDPKEFMRQFGLLARLAALAEKSKLPERAPHKERLAYTRMNVLMQGLLDEKSNAIPPADELEKYYKVRGRDFAEAYVKVLYVSFVTGDQPAPAGGKKPLNEAEAKAKIESLRKQVTSGGDFVKVIQENSDDAVSREKNGDYPPLKIGDSIPENVKQAVFSLKPGAYSEVVRQPNGFYVFRLEKLVTPPLAAVREQVERAVKDALFKGWLEQVRAEVNGEVKFMNEDFFRLVPTGPPAGAPAVPGAPKP
jgi:peptidyl-prolyl cis-trans isomerase C